MSWFLDHTREGWGMKLASEFRRRSLAPFLAFTIVATGSSQPPANALSPAAFEVASVKVNASAGPGGSIRTTPGGRFEAVNSTLQALIRYAYNVRDFQITGEPNWFEATRYDITAKAKDKASTPEIRLMVQELLTDRFALALHRETRQLPVNSLVPARQGLRMKENVEGDSTVASGPGEITAKKIPLRVLVNQLATSLGRSVIDRTDLKSTYDVTLRWSPQNQAFPLDGSAPPDPGGPSILSAVQEQLGLRLEPDKGPVEVLVIESANKTPKEN